MSCVSSGWRPGSCMEGKGKMTGAGEQGDERDAPLLVVALRRRRVERRGRRVLHIVPRVSSGGDPPLRLSLLSRWCLLVLASCAHQSHDSDLPGLPPPLPMRTLLVRVHCSSFSKQGTVINSPNPEGKKAHGPSRPAPTMRAARRPKPHLPAMAGAGKQPVF